MSRWKVSEPQMNNFADSKNKGRWFVNVQPIAMMHRLTVKERAEFSKSHYDYRHVTKHFDYKDDADKFYKFIKESDWDAITEAWQKGEIDF